MTELDYKGKLTRADVEVLNGSINREVRTDPLSDAMVKLQYKIWLWQNNPMNAELRGISKPVGYAASADVIPE